MAAAPVPTLRGLRGLVQRGLGIAAMHGAVAREIAVAEALHRFAPVRVLVLGRSRHQRHLVLVVGVRVVILRLIIIDRVIIIGAGWLADHRPLLIIINRLPILHLGVLRFPIGMRVLHGALVVSVALAVFATLLPFAIFTQRWVVAFLNISLSLWMVAAAACLPS